MNSSAIFGLQFVLSLSIFAVLAAWFLAPWLATQSKHAALTLLAIPHAFRHIGLVFLVPNVVARPLASDFANAAAYGDLAAGLLALLAMIALRKNWPFALGFTWLFNIVGTLDLLNALRHVNVVPDFGAAWYIPTFLVPLLLVTHAMSFAWLTRELRTTRAQP